VHYKSIALTTPKAPVECNCQSRNYTNSLSSRIRKPEVATSRCWANSKIPTIRASTHDTQTPIPPTIPSNHPPNLRNPYTVDDNKTHTKLLRLARDNDESWFRKAKLQSQSKDVWYTVETTVKKYVWISNVKGIVRAFAIARRTPKRNHNPAHNSYNSFSPYKFAKKTYKI
jgi:hypothetical protein